MKNYTSMLVCKTQSIINEFINNSTHDLQLIAMMALIQFIQQLYARRKLWSVGKDKSALA